MLLRLLLRIIILQYTSIPGREVPILRFSVSRYEPWHDAECCIDGPPAWDVFTHFEQEWRELAKDHVNALLPISEMRGLAHPPGWRFDKPHWSENTCPELAAADESDPATWHVQVFRSADSASHAGLPEDPEEDFKCGLFREKGVVVDRSIQNAYVHTIRRARRFLYIENQYFVGSSYAWPRWEKSPFYSISLHFVSGFWLHRGSFDAVSRPR